MVTEAISPEFLSKLEARGVSRRSFMKLCGSLAVAAGLSELAAPRVARAIEDSVIGAESGGLYPAIWMFAPKTDRAESPQRSRFAKPALIRKS